MLEPAAAMTDWGLAALGVAMGVMLLMDEESVSRYWVLTFLAIALDGALGAVYHTGLKAHPTLGEPTWDAITIVVALTISFLLAGSVDSVLGEGRNPSWMLLRVATLTLLILATIAGRGGLGVFGVIGSAMMAAIVGLWSYAFANRLPGSGTMVIAILLSAAAALTQTLPTSFDLGWHWDAGSLYHVAQVPGLVALFIAIRRISRAAAGGGWPLPDPLGRLPSRAVMVARIRAPLVAVAAFLTALLR